MKKGRFVFWLDTAVFFVVMIIAILGLYELGRLIIWLFILIWPILIIVFRLLIGYATLNMICYCVWGTSKKWREEGSQMKDIILWGAVFTIESWFGFNEDSEGM